MNIEQAVKVLNEHGHAGFTWEVNHRGDCVQTVEGRPRLMTFEPFEAIAVAEAYERYADRDMPATRRLMAHFKSLFGEQCRAVNGPDSHWFHDSRGKTLTLGEIDAAFAEWEAKP